MKLIIFLAVMFFAFILAIIEYKRKDVTFSEEKVDTIYVMSAEDLTKKLANHYNDIFIFADDIVVEEQFSLGSQDHPFVGKVIGNGYSLTLKGNCNSLFEYIGEGGIVEDINIIFEKVGVEIKDFGLLAIENRGVIRNVKLTVEEFQYVGTGMKTLGMVAAFNYGEIDSVVLDYTVKNMLKGSTAPAMGGICAKNYGTIKNVLVFPHHEDFKELEPGNTNSKIGAVYLDAYGDSSFENCYAVFVANDFAYKDTEVLSSKRKVTAIDPSEVTGEFLDTLSFDDRYWEVIGDELFLKPLGSGGVADKTFFTPFSSSSDKT